MLTDETEQTETPEMTETTEDTELIEDSALTDREQEIVYIGLDEVCGWDSNGATWGDQLYRITTVETAVLAYYRYQNGEYDTIEDAVDEAADDIREDYDGLRHVEEHDELYIDEIALEYIENQGDEEMEWVLEASKERSGTDADCNSESVDASGREDT